MTVKLMLASVAIAFLLPTLSSALAAPASALLPAVGQSQSFIVTTSFKGPQPPEGAAPENQTGRLTVSRVDLKTVRVSFQSDSGHEMGTATIEDAKIFDQDAMYGPYIAPYDNALVIAAGAAGRRAGDRWSASIALAPPMPPPGEMPPPPPPDANGPPRTGSMGSGFRVMVPRPQTLTLSVTVVSLSGSTIKLSGTGTVTRKMPTPKGDMPMTVTMNVDEMISAGRVVYYDETVEHTLNGRQGQIKVTSATTLEATNAAPTQRMSQHA
jgi:hypothetical protein